MKKDDNTNLLLIGAAAIGVWYFFIRPKTPVPTAPAYNGYVPANAVTPAGAVSTTNALNSLLAAGQKLLSPAAPASNLVATPATDNSATVQQQVNSLFSTPSLNTINTGMPQTYAPPALTNNTIFNSQPAVLQPAATPDNTSNTPPVYVANNDALYMEFENGDYPGASISGPKAAKLGLY